MNNNDRNDQEKKRGKAGGKIMYFILLIKIGPSVEEKRGQLEMTFTTSHMQWSASILETKYRTKDFKKLSDAVEK